MTNGVSGNGHHMAPDTGGVQYGEGTLKNIKIMEKREKNADGVFENYKQYRATLTDGTVVTYTAQ